MKTLLNKWFIAGCLTWLIIFSCRRFHHPIPFINGYLTDAIAIPVISMLGLWFQRVFIIKNDYYVLSAWHVAFIVLYVALLFEGLLPMMSKTYTADWMDGLLYALGGFFFYRVMNQPVVTERIRPAG